MSPRLLLTLVALGATGHAQLVYEPAAAVSGLSGPAKFLVTGDLDGDGVDDLVVSTSFGPTTAALGDGAGSFDVSSVGAGKTWPFGLADVDGDGVLDLVHSTPTPSVAAVSLGDGAGGFAAATPLTPPPASGIDSLSSLDLGDVNGDGFVDVLFTQGLLSLVPHVFVGVGDGTFVETAVLPAEINARASLGDVDGDRLDDIVIEGLGTTWRPSLGDGGFGAPTPAPAGLVADVLGDAAVEFVTVEGAAETLEIVLRSWDGGAFEEVARVAAPFAYGSVTVSVDDVDGDGLQDLVTFAGSYGHVFRQVPGDDFTLAASFTAFGDLNRDASSVRTSDGRRDLAFIGLFTGVGLARDVTYADGEPFADLGGATPAAFGFPTQVLAADGADLSVRVLTASPSVPISGVWGASLGPPLRTSATSPSPDRVLGPFTTSPDGTLEVLATDALPIGLDVYAQWWVADGGTLASTSTVRIDD